ncbi:MAG TPA: hypothetical protein VFC19_08505 [Candidatus Limnocylindrales bacterium]|nr:hypothetical protein [Candidatus Limnocylindrales bacterium]
MTKVLSENLSSPHKVLAHLAPSAWLLDIVKSLTGVDVATDLVAPFVGRWDGVNAYSEAMTNVSRCVQSVSAGVTTISTDLGTKWQGKAAGTAHAHLASISASLHSDSEALADIGLRYRELATAMQCGQVAAEIMLKAVLDAAMEVAVWMAAGTSTSRTPVGFVIGYGMATYKTARLVHLIEEWTRLVVLARADTEKVAGTCRPTAA